MTDDEFLDQAITVGQLKLLLSNFSDDTKVVVVDATHDRYMRLTDDFCASSVNGREIFTFHSGVFFATNPLSLLFERKPT
jgi:hypothetical protein